MAGGLTLDCGALIQYEKHDARIRAVLTKAEARQATLTVPSVVVAQAFRSLSARMAKLLAECEVDPLDDQNARQVGRLLGASHTSDIVDATVVWSAYRRRDHVVSSDPRDMERLIEALDRMVAKKTGSSGRLRERMLVIAV